MGGKQGKGNGNVNTGHESYNINRVIRVGITEKVKLEQSLEGMRELTRSPGTPHLFFRYILQSFI